MRVACLYTMFLKSFPVTPTLQGRSTGLILLRVRHPIRQVRLHFWAGRAAVDPIHGFIDRRRRQIKRLIVQLVGGANLSADVSDVGGIDLKDAACPRFTNLDRDPEKRSVNIALVERLVARVDRVDFLSEPGGEFVVGAFDGLALLREVYDRVRALVDDLGAAVRRRIKGNRLLTKVSENEAV
jgi:hypothetical protein